MGGYDGGMETTLVTCAACTGPYSPATGHVHQHEPLVVLCGPCARHFYAYVRTMMKRKSGGVSFYTYAATSVRAE